AGSRGQGIVPRPLLLLLIVRRRRSFLAFALEERPDAGRAGPQQAQAEHRQHPEPQPARRRRREQPRESHRPTLPSPPEAVPTLHRLSYHRRAGPPRPIHFLLSPRHLPRYNPHERSNPPAAARPRPHGARAASNTGRLPMFRLALGRTRGYCDGVSRRSFLQVGMAGMAAIGLPELIRAREQSSEKKDTSVILIWLDGGPGHMD